MIHDLFQKIMQEAFQARLPPALCAADDLDHLFRFAAVIDEYDALFIQSKGEAEFVFFQITPVRNLKSPGQRVEVDLGLCVVYIPRVKIQLDAHIEALTFALPFRRRQNRSVLHCLPVKNVSL